MHPYRYYLTAKLWLQEKKVHSTEGASLGGLLAKYGQAKPLEALDLKAIHDTMYLGSFLSRLITLNVRSLQVKLGSKANCSLPPT
jgi:hypothetical protein